MFPDGQGVSNDRSNEEMEGEKEEDIGPQRNESLQGKQKARRRQTLEEKCKEITEGPTENAEVEEATNQKTEVGVREAGTELQTIQTLEADGI